MTIINAPSWFAAPVTQFRDLRQRAFEAWAAPYGGISKQASAMLKASDPIAFRNAAKAAGTPIGRTDIKLIRGFQSHCLGLALVIQMDHPGVNLAHYTSTASLTGVTKNDTTGHAGIFLPGCKRDQDPVFGFYNGLIEANRPAESSTRRIGTALNQMVRKLAA